MSLPRPLGSLPLLVALLLPSLRLAAQNDTSALAAAIVRSMAPATDDPDAVALDLLETALLHRRSPAACFLVEEAMRRIGALQTPQRLLDAMTTSPGDRQHGLLALRLQELRWYLERAATGPIAPEPGREPFPDYASQVLAVGPFGDHGDHFVGVPFAPELLFPALGAELPGRGATARVRRIERERDQRRIALGSRVHDLPGCYYALHRIAITTATAGYLEVDCDGEYQVFVDGAEVLRVRPWLEPGPTRRQVPLQLPAGPHEALAKTGSVERHSVSLRWIDAEGGPLAAAVEIAADAKRQPVIAPASVEGAPFVTALDVFARAANAADATPAQRIAAIRCASRSGAIDLSLAIADRIRREPPTDAIELLAFAQAVAGLDLPEEARAAEARSLEEKALTTLPREHHRGRLAEAQLLEQQDRREDAMRLLAKHPAPGPETWAYRHALARRLRFEAEDTPLLRAWAAACPRDPRPVFMLAELASGDGDPRGALVLLLQANRLRPDQNGALRRAFDLALDLGDTATATSWLDQLAPVAAGAAPDLDRLKLELRLAEATDPQTYAARLQAIGEHPDADPATLERAATRWTQLGNQPATITTLQKSLAIDADQPAVRAWLAGLGALPIAGADFVAFRRDGDAARTAFQPSEREQGATSTVVLGQRIVEFHTDGSWLAEVHELRRINDLAGVEEFRTASAPAHADEVLLLRTIGTDGRVYVPPKVQEDYSLQRLEPGTFVEMRYREHGSAPGADALRTERFYFQSADAPIGLAELVVILPDPPRGALRGHLLGEPSHRQQLPDGRTALVFTRLDAARLPQERLSPRLDELVPFAELGEDQTPFAVLREIRVQLMSRTQPTPAVRTAAESVFSGLSDDRSRIAAAWAYGQREIETGPAESAAHAILRKKGNRFLVTVALLRAAGIEVVATACRDERAELGAGDDAVFQSGDHHQTPGAMIRLATGEVIHLFVDAPRHWPLGAVPAGRAGTTAFAVAEGGVEVVTLPTSRHAAQDLSIRGKAAVAGNDVKLEATIEIGDVQGYALAERIRELKDDVRKLAARQIAQQLLPGWKMQSAQVALDTPGKPFTLQCTAQRTCVQQDGDRWRVPLPMPPGRFLATYGDRAERKLPVRLTAEQVTDWDFTFDPGPGFALATVPPPVLVQQDSLLYQLTCERLGSGLRIRRLARVLPMELPREHFGDWLRGLAAADRADMTSLELVARSQ